MFKQPYNVEALPPLIVIGRQTEAEAKVIEFDISAWLDKWPGMACHVFPTLPGERFSYPATSDQDGNILRWRVSQGDTIRSGTGRVEIRGLLNGVRKMSAFAFTHIDETSVDPSHTPPDAARPWVDEVLEAARAAEEATDKMPCVGENGNWMCWNAQTGTFEDSGIPATGPQGPMITNVYIKEKPLFNGQGGRRYYVIDVDGAPAYGFEVYDGQKGEKGDSADLMNLVDGEAEGSVRSVVAAEETAEYKMGNRAVALGSAAKASGMNSIALGMGTTASGIGATALSGGNASGSGSLAAGTGAKATGRNAIALGNQTDANGVRSVVFGYYTAAEGDDQTVIGRRNIPDEEGKYAFIIGNGPATAASSDKHSNAFAVDWEGNAYGGNGKKLVSEEDLFVTRITSSDAGYYVASHTAAEINAAKGAGAACIAVVKALPIESLVALTMTLTSASDAKVEFEGWAYRSGIEDEQTGIWRTRVTVDAYGVATLGLSCPETTPNPNKLKLTGAVEAEYDGSKEIVVEIPKASTENETIILPETMPVYDHDVPGYIITTPWVTDMVAGNVYKVAYNSKPYECEAIDGKTFGAPNGIVALGNLSAMGQVGGNPDAPFLIVAMPVSTPEESPTAGAIYGMVSALDGAESVTISISDAGQTAGGIKPITLTLGENGVITSDTAFEDAWALTDAQLAAAIVVREKGAYYGQESDVSTSVTVRRLAVPDGTKWLQLGFGMHHDWLDRAGQSDTIRYIDWTPDIIRLSTTRIHSLPDMTGGPYDQGTYYMCCVNGMWVPVTLDQLKADLGLT